MKRINKHTIIFIVAFIFIAAGFCGEYRTALKTCGTTFVEQIKANDPDAIKNFTAEVDSIAAEELRYHDTLVDVDSLKNNLLNVRVIEKDDTTVIKTNTDRLVIPQSPIPDTSMQTIVENIDDLYRAAQNDGAAFLYVAAPSKSYFATMPANIDDHTVANHDRFLQAMQESAIPLLDLTTAMQIEDTLGEEAFFVTDHHWKPTVGFQAARAICEELHTQYGFTYDQAFTDMSNYTVKTYEDWFLGSYGKKVGRCFTFEGAEDIELITPTFETTFTEEQPYKSRTRTGSFEEVLLNTDFISTKDPYHLNPYAAYSGGDFRLQIIKNEQNPDGDTMLIIRDSFACAVTPFLSLNTGELHVVDIRDYIPSDSLNVYDYIEEIDPDYVVVLYNGVLDFDDADEKYNFNQ